MSATRKLPGLPWQQLFLILALLPIAPRLPAEVPKTDAFTQQSSSLQVVFGGKQPGLAALAPQE